MKKLLIQYAWILGLGFGIMLIAILTFPGPEVKEDFLLNKLEEVKKEKQILTEKEIKLKELSTQKEWEEIDKKDDNN